MDHWPAIKVKRFPGEQDLDYQARAEEVRAIVTGFRHGLYTGARAEEMERHLIKLQTAPARA